MRVDLVGLHRVVTPSIFHIIWRVSDADTGAALRTISSARPGPRQHLVRRVKAANQAAVERLLGLEDPRSGTTRAPG